VSAQYRVDVQRSAIATIGSSVFASRSGCSQIKSHLHSWEKAVNVHLTFIEGRVRLEDPSLTCVGGNLHKRQDAPQRWTLHSCVTRQRILLGAVDQRSAFAEVECRVSWFVSAFAQEQTPLVDILRACPGALSLRPIRILLSR
jgi:hypothetical protein